jgi:hypothetical protein
MSLNIAPHIPQVVVNAAAPATEALARSNAVKEVVPAPVKVDAAPPKKTREQEAKADANVTITYDKRFAPDPLIIPDDPQQNSERNSDGNAEQDDSGDSSFVDPQVQDGAAGASSSSSSEAVSEAASAITGDGSVPINGQDSEEQTQAEQQQEAREASRNKESEEAKQQEEIKRETQELAQRDLEVRNHELAHATVGGAYAGTPNYQYENGPNGVKYAVKGEVPIDVTVESDPRKTIRKMQTVRNAALAPADPSTQDKKVAAEATRNISDARIELLRESQEELQKVAEVIAKKYDPSALDPTPKAQGFSAVA